MNHENHSPHFFDHFFCIVHSLILYLRSVKTSKVERGGWWSGLHYHIAMMLGEYNIRSKQRFYEIKFVTGSNPGNQFHWNEMYFQQISYSNILPSCIIAVVCINWFLFLNERNDIALFGKKKSTKNKTNINMKCRKKHKK